MSLYLQILSSKQQRILEKLSFTKDLKLYLAGGTALALQIGHRTSIDFDFYTKEHFKKGELVKLFKDNLEKEYSLKVLRDFDDTFEIQIDNLHLSCFYYPYSLIDKLVEIDNIQIASVKDIAAMKIVAISQRGKRRDFIDIYYLIKKMGLAKILSLTQKKYPEFDYYNGLRGLLYFVDADKDKEAARIKIFDNDFSWKKVKEFIKRQVFDFQKNY
jgi:predicted nucleotidyltransferase component of viral defense system